MPHADTMYLFRHALLREGAYQLMPPALRSGLHMAAIEVLQQLTPLDRKDAIALDLADHARLACEGASAAQEAALRRQELGWLQRAAEALAHGFQKQAEADAWRRIVDHLDASVTQRAHALRRVAMLDFSASRGQPLKALEEGERLFRSVSDAGALARILCDKGRVLLYTGRAADAEAAIQEGLLLSDTPESSAELLCELALVHVQTGRLVQAEGALRRAGTLVQLDHTAARTARGHLANVLRRLGRRDEARLLYAQSEKEMQARNDHSDLAALYANLGVLAIEEDRLEEADNYCRRAGELMARTGERRKLATLKCNQAIIMNRRGDTKGSARLEMEAVEAAIDDGDLSLAAHVLLNHEQGLLQRGDLAGAGGCVARALDFASRAGDTVNRARARSALAEQATLMGRFEDAASHLNEAERLVAELRLELIEQQYVTPARVRLSLATREYSKAGVALARLEQLGERLSRDEYASTELQNFWQDLAAVEQVTAPGSKSSLYHGFRRSQLSPELLAALGDP